MSEQEMKQMLSAVLAAVEMNTAEIQGLKHKIDEVEVRLTAKIVDVEERLTAKIDDVEVRLTAKIVDVEERLTAKIDDVEVRLSQRIDTLQENFIDAEAWLTKKIRHLNLHRGK